MHIFLFLNDEQQGPYNLGEVLHRLESGELAPDTLAWTEGSDWKPIKEVLQWSPRSAPAPVVRPSRQKAIAKWTFVTVFVTWFLVTLFIQEQAKQSTSEAPTDRAKSPIEIQNAKAEWRIERGGSSYPRLKFIVRNTGSATASFLLKAVFVDGDGVITSEPTEYITDLPPGRAKGPLFLEGTVGFNNDSALPRLLREKKMWQYELYYRESIFGKDWVRLKSGTVLVWGEAAAPK